MPHTDLSRRLFLQLAAAAPWAIGATASAATSAARKAVPIGLEMFTLRGEEERDRMGTLRAVKEMGYDGVEFYGIYTDWTLRAQDDVNALQPGTYPPKTRVALRTPDPAAPIASPDGSAPVAMGQGGDR